MENSIKNAVGYMASMHQRVIRKLPQVLHAATRKAYVSIKDIKKLDDVEFYYLYYLPIDLHCTDKCKKYIEDRIDEIQSHLKVPDKLVIDSSESVN